MAAYSDPFEDRSRGRGGDRPRDRSGDRHRDRSPHRHRDRSNTRARDREPDRDRRDTKPRNDRGGPHDRRDRSRSPRRERGGRRGDSHRYRSRSPLNKPDRGREPPKGPRGGEKDGRAPARPTGPRGDDAKPSQSGPVKTAKPASTPDKDVKMTGSDIPEGVDEETWEMMKVMGFGSFKSTKETKVPGNDKNYGVRKDTMMKARQYMNRQGGFNRPLSPGR